MSAILQTYKQKGTTGALGVDGVRRYKTRCKILVDSHNSASPKGNSETIVLTDDVYSVETGKTIKGEGTANISLTPSQNYLNLIFPNDYINIYFDIGDGSGWTRTFFGFVDRVEETYTVGQGGTPTTVYRLACTDFYKAFDKTMIYFNPQMSGRPDFEDVDFAAPNIGGLALMSKGVVVGGAPSDIVENVTLILLGFGTQFKLPASYAPGDTQDRLRARRVEGARGRLPPESLKKLDDAGGYTALRAKVEADAAGNVTDTSAANDVTNFDRQDQTNALARIYGIPDSKVLDGLTDPDLIKYLTNHEMEKVMASSKDSSSLAGTTSASANRNANILLSAESPKSALIDLIDTFTFIERRAMDGFIFDQPVWQRQGSIVSILRSVSNEAINELFFDLRPLSADTSGKGKSVAAYPVAGAYSTEADDKKGNTTDKEGTRDGISYIPAIVMREYPFSTIDRVDMGSTAFTLKEEDGTPALLGLLHFGDIFNQGPNFPGRHVVTIPNINMADLTKGDSTALGLKHLDVAVIEEVEIVSTSLGRSDNDHYNLFEFISDSMLGTDMYFYMKDFLPIINPIHVTRNGLRPRKVTTRAARFSLGQLINIRSGTPEGLATIEEKDEVPLVDTIGAPVQAPSLAGFNPSIAGANWGYRKKKPKDAVNNSDRDWIWHNGVDIFIKPVRVDKVPEELDDDGDPKKKANRPDANKKIPIYAIADGWIVASAPNGTVGGYGEFIIIKHKFTAVTGFRYSVYAHLSDRAFHLGPHLKQGSEEKRSQYFATDMTGVLKGRQKAKKVSKNTIIGWMGHTGTSKSSDHLHFEIDRHFPPAKGMRRENYTPLVPIIQSGESRPPIDPDGKLTPDDLTNASSGLSMPDNFNSCDPNLFYGLLGANLADLINKAQAPETDGEEDEEDETDTGTNPQDENKSREDEGVTDEIADIVKETSKSVTRDSVDTPSIRRQLARWALLQDHWYQHNLEYLSGRVDMRGAPEIRVGYRLDIEDRNMSFYVEGVNHSWQFPNSMKTSLQVTRGQPNNPFPLYVLPAFEPMGATANQRRRSTSRLGTFFITPDPVAIRRSLFLNPTGRKFDPGSFSGLEAAGHTGRNEVDYIDPDGWDGIIATKFDEAVIPAGATERPTETIPEYEPAEDKGSNTTVIGENRAAAISREDPQRLRNRRGKRR